MEFKRLVTHVRSSLLLHTLVLFLIVWCVSSGSLAATIRVERDGSGDFDTLQPAINAAARGDTILIGPGRYDEYTREIWSQWHKLDMNAHVSTRDLTFIGTDRDAVIIGPEVPIESSVDHVLEGFRLEDGRSTRIESLTIENTSSGIVGYAQLQLRNVVIRGIEEIAVHNLSREPLMVEGCTIEDCGDGLLLGVGQIGTQIRNSVFKSIRFKCIGAGKDDDIEVQGCTFIATSHFIGVAVYGHSQAQITDCRFELGGVGAGVSIDGSSVAEVNSCHFSVGYGSIGVGNLGHLSGKGNVLEGGTYCTLLFMDESTADFSKNDILHASGPTVLIHLYGALGDGQVDLRHNYWGTDEPDSIAAWIHDAQDDPTLAPTVLYKPFKKTTYFHKRRSFGRLKAGRLGRP